MRLRTAGNAADCRIFTYSRFLHTQPHFQSCDPAQQVWSITDVASWSTLARHAGTHFVLCFVLVVGCMLQFGEIPHKRVHCYCTCLIPWDLGTHQYLCGDSSALSKANTSVLWRIIRWTLDTSLCGLRHAHFYRMSERV